MAAAAATPGRVDREIARLRSRLDDMEPGWYHGEVLDPRHLFPWPLQSGDFLVTGPFRSTQYDRDPADSVAVANPPTGAFWYNIWYVETINLQTTTPPVFPDLDDLTTDDTDEIVDYTSVSDSESESDRDIDSPDTYSDTDTTLSIHSSDEESSPPAEIDPMDFDSYIFRARAEWFYDPGDRHSDPREGFRDVYPTLPPSDSDLVFPTYSALVEHLRDRYALLTNGIISASWRGTRDTLERRIARLRRQKAALERRRGKEEEDVASGIDVQPVYVLGPSFGTLTKIVICRRKSDGRLVIVDSSSKNLVCTHTYSKNKEKLRAKQVKARSVCPKCYS